MDFSEKPIEPKLAPAVIDLLYKHGKSVGPFLPWHETERPYNWLVAELLLRRTTRTAAHKAYNALVESFPDWQALLYASRDEIIEKIAWVGLGNQRSKQLKGMAQVVVQSRDFDFCDRDNLLSLPGVGKYIADAILLYVCMEGTFPIDANVQRVLRRVVGLSTPSGTRHVDPYIDSWLKGIVAELKDSLSAQHLRWVHMGIMLVAWDTCRPKPNCLECVLRGTCQYALGLSG